MATTVVLTDVVKTTGGRVRVIFGDGTVLEFSDLAHLTEEVLETDQDAHLVRMMALGWILARQPTLDNIAPIRDKNFTFDLSNPSPIKVQ